MKKIDVTLMQNANWPLLLSLFVLLGAFCLQYCSEFANLLIRWNHQDFSYCYLVPFLFMYLIYTNRHALKSYEIQSSRLGIAVLLLSGFIYLLGKLGSIETLVYISIWLVFVGLVVLLMGVKITRALAFPLIVLAFIVPLPRFLNNLFTFKLKLVSSAVAVKMMQLKGLSVLREGNIIDLGVTQLQLVDACSGLRYVYPLLLIGLLFGYLFHRKWWERAVILLVTIPISVLSNALRIAITGYLTMEVSAKAAETFFHGFSGWLIFIISFAFLAVISGLLRLTKVRLTNEAPSKDKKDNITANSLNLDNIKTSYVWTASVLLLLFWGLDNTMAMAQLRPSRKTFDEFPTTIGEWKGERSYVRPEILKELWADDYVQIKFRHSKTGDSLLLFIPYYEYQGTRHTAHSPVSCLIGGGYAPLSRKILERKFPEPFGKAQVRQMVLQKTRLLLLSNYWFQQRGRIVVSEYLNKWYLFWDSLTKRRTDGALIRLEMVLRGDQDIKTAQSVIDTFTLELMKILPQYVPV